MKSNAEAIQLLEQLLRAQPRNSLVLEVCAELRARITEGKPKGALRPFDKVAYQREYMRKQRAATRSNPRRTNTAQPIAGEGTHGND